MIISDKAIQVLKADGISAFRVFFDGISCRKTQIGFALTEPEADDEVFVLEGIKVGVDPAIEYEAEIVTLDHDGSKFVFTGLEKELS